MKYLGSALLTSAALALAACNGGSSMTEHASTISAQPFGLTPDGQAVERYVLKNRHGIEMVAMNYGGIILSLRTPDRDGQFDDIVLGHDTLPPYITNPPFFGALIGRYANRIAKGRFSLDGHTYQLATNDGPNHLHGGARGWDHAVWRVEPFNDKRGVGLELSRTSPDGEEGYPGRVKATVTYTLTDQDQLRIDYVATADRPTIVNLTQHSYFNLAGAHGATVLGHELTINADRYTPIDATLIPTGELAPVSGTPFDFRRATTIGARISQKDAQLERGRGYDHNFVLNHAADGLTLAANVYEPSTGRTLEVRTTEPGLQFYSGNFLDGAISGKNGVAYGQRTGFCLETQHFPDSPNRAEFPSTAIAPDSPFRSTTIFTFGARAR